jgi:hypothetical protein
VRLVKKGDERKMPKRNRAKILNAVTTMPPLYHSVPGQCFDIRNSEVIKWLVKQPEILNYVWNNIKNDGSVFYDSETGKWQGVDYGAD